MWCDTHRSNTTALYCGGYLLYRHHGNISKRSEIFVQYFLFLLVLLKMFSLPNRKQQLISIFTVDNFLSHLIWEYGFSCPLYWYTNTTQVLHSTKKYAIRFSFEFGKYFFFRFSFRLLNCKLVGNANRYQHCTFYSVLIYINMK